MSKPTNYDKLTEVIADPSLLASQNEQLKVEITELRAALARVQQFPADLDLQWSGQAVKEWIDNALINK